ncbi:hypothetical protein GCM10009718_12310 [Isoptericola halotolerans]|uniref:Aromatic acid exporter family member 1 n=1 Tax=Isoptericola halotolerans TaxID=300560 RepID=A0ABX2A2L3_9MICO|nr:hypothetical protein [Isoptericola halotolerans]NOV95848.1 hypothetical protein [Isoptericola halotolerans]
MDRRKVVRALARVHRTWLRHPRWSLASRGALAAGIAWFVGVLAPAPLSDYPYYAPLGAVIATTSTLVRSVRDSVQVTAALLVGAGIARAADVFLSPGALSVALVVGASLLISGWRGFGEMGSWVATSAIFVLILGNVDALEYVGSFAGLVVAGAAVGVAINLALPPLPLRLTEDALEQLSDVLADEMEDLADDLDEPGALVVDAWDLRRRAVHGTLDRTRAAVEGIREAGRANVRVRRHRRWSRGQEVRSRELETAAASVEQVLGLLVDVTAPIDLGVSLRSALVDALRSTAAVLRADAWDPERDELVDRLAEVVREFERRVREEAPQVEVELVAGALVVSLQRAVEAFRE